MSYLRFEKKTKQLIFGLCLGAGLLTALLLLDEYLPSYHLKTVETKPDQVVAADTIKPLVLHGVPFENCEVIEDNIAPNQRFIDLIEDYYVTPKVHRQLSTLPKRVFNFSRLRPKDNYSLVVEKDSLRSLKALVYEPDKLHYVLFQFQDSLTVEKCDRDVQLREQTVAATIESSLWETIQSLNISSSLTNKFVDVFDWKIDFHGLQAGDRFRIIYVEQVLNGEQVGIESIIGVSFQHRGERYYGFGYDHGNGIEYFDEEGNSCQAQLLKYPIEFTRISSRYSRRRFHPVAKVYRPHLGTDFAAPTGTPIRSAGDGVVLEARYKSNNGNYVKIKHNRTYTTGYLHMSRIASRMKPGVRVKRGQTIGYVGKTGLATGPHLCYRFWKNGVQVDALRAKIPSKKKIKDALKKDYMARVDTIMKKLKLIPFLEPEINIAAR